LANTGFQTMYNHIGLEPIAWRYAPVIWNLAKWNSVKWNKTRRIGAIFCMLPRRAGLSASAGLSCLFQTFVKFVLVHHVANCLQFILTSFTRGSNKYQMKLVNSHIFAFYLFSKT